MDWTGWIEAWGEPAVLACCGLVLGLGFGFFGQRSKFCLRAAVIEFWHRRFGDKLAVWLLAFATAVVAVQWAVLAGGLDVSTARQLSARGSLSGALVGGLLFGIGMVMTRGCASRLLVLSANGNLRALLSGLVFAVAAQASLGGVLAPWREAVAGWWVVDGGASRSLLALLGGGPAVGLAFGLVWMAAALFFAVRSGWGFWKWFGGMATGLTVAGGWYATHQVMAHSFEVVQIQGLTFSGPSAEWLMHVLHDASGPWTFGLGLMPGVFIGSLAGALLGREWKLEGFGGGYTMPRYIGGAVLMGFGSMLAGGCAVGAGMTGGAIFAVTAWLALLGMWLGGGLADRVLDRPVHHTPSAVPGVEPARAP
ncbi:YeeE/YedE family protein [Aquabacterium sp. A08]|uniref:YeeE/YedE family protein n=1 Tax=Aquabacterium sp. A08 TaxID=2718532 RepID=UPI001420B471|nr:YeeE/YedE family protein [Aquabacterium sp. A08]NIC41689.1 YeeE/YedE family protein [Aquabacterium sp. A08]NIC41707.1 YeeE/YedE family protein [Aquabacterium sp. A08]